MSEQEFLWYFAKVAVPVIAIITPVLRLNASIIKLNERLSMVLQHNGVQDGRLNKHSDRLDNLDKTTTNHDARISVLENKDCKYETDKFKRRDV